MAIHLTPEANPTVQEGTLYVDSATGEFNVAGRTTPHIIPGVLYPAVAGNDIHGTDIDTSHGSTYTYGTAHTDGRKYYYTDIKGSKPIKDPRVGGYFGSQRHEFTSLQLLEQETATHGKNVFSVDGREWARIVEVTSGGVTAEYTGNGTDIVVGSDKEAWIEIVGYFNAANIIMRVLANRKSLTPYINGTAGSAQTPQEASASTPLSDRYVDAGSVVALTLPSTTLGINTLLIKDNIEGSHYTNYHYGIELIAQDTTSTANRSKIQIPSQNVVSYGKKFTVSGTPHYDPFNGFVDDTTLFSAKVDTATSLGLGTATTWGASWDTGSDDHIRPFNGGRVIKWVDSGGTIKTSVTMMPRNAQNIGTTASNKITDVSSTNTQTINFSDDAVEHSLSEVAKTFHWREFGNGSANGGTGSATYADASMLNTSDDIAYVMDDGLTSLSGDDVIGESGTGGLQFAGNSDVVYVTFIGTGISLKTTTGGDYTHKATIDGVDLSTSGHATATHLDIAQNLPYGTHIFKWERIATSGSGDTKILELTFHQPKRPLIPEDACVLADYMLMADYVKQTDCEDTQISKGVRMVSGSRDIFVSDAVNGTNGTARVNVWYGPPGLYGFLSHASSSTTVKLPFFGTNVQVRVEATNQAHHVDFAGSSNVAHTDLDHSSSAGQDMMTIDNSATLGTQEITCHVYQGGHGFVGFDVVSPIHTSSHYQPFETPFLHELVGGDRNMEQNNLVCSPDGKTWDEVTRDTSYIGNRDTVLNRTNDTASTSTAQWIIDEVRGKIQFEEYGNKNFVVAYNEILCLKEGMYIINFGSHHGSSVHVTFKINGTSAKMLHSGGNSNSYMASTFRLERGDKLTFFGGWSHPSTETYHSVINIHKA
tara:strand:- start:1521 stop:4148 length:2628 start_codon:yes stop_codon:yes gene_type:complete